MFDITAMLPGLAALNLLCAWQIRQLARVNAGLTKPAALRAMGA